jgi:phage terminase small subunit
MTGKQRAFADHVISGKNLTESYRLAYPASLRWDRHMTKKEAWKTANKPHIKAYIDEAVLEAKQAASLTREDLLLAMGKIVKRVGKDANAPATAVVAATQQASRMLGCDAPTKIEMKVEGSLLFRIRKQSAAR